MTRWGIRGVLCLLCVALMAGANLVGQAAAKRSPARRGATAKKRPSAKERPSGRKRPPAKKKKKPPAKKKKPARKGLPASKLGVNVKVFNPYGDVYAPTDLSVASGAGLGVVRLEANEGVDMDGIVGWLAESHLRLYPYLGLPCPVGSTDCGFETQVAPAAAVGEMAQYVTAFAQRYGPGGSFWSQNPQLPYLPVESFEIGNEPNLRLIFAEDETHLHWNLPSDPLLADDADYAAVYEAARTALHAVDPTGVAVVGGLADSAGYGVDVLSDEAVLNALPRGAVDAVGYHPWVFYESDALLEPDTTDLRVWMNQHGFAHVPLDVNEVGACGASLSAIDSQGCEPVQPSVTWGAAAAAYTKWALCTPWLKVENVQPFVWGATPVTDQDLWLPLVTGGGTATPYGQDFLREAHALSTTGCPAAAVVKKAKAPAGSVPRIEGIPGSGKLLTSIRGTWTGKPRPRFFYQWEMCTAQFEGCIVIAGANKSSYRLQPSDDGSRISVQVTAISTAGGATRTSAQTPEIDGVAPAPLSMALGVVRVTAHGRRVSIVVRSAPGSGTVTVAASRRGRHGVRLLRAGRGTATTTTFTGKLTAGRWLLTVSGEPQVGYLVPKPTVRRVSIAA